MTKTPIRPHRSRHRCCKQIVGDNIIAASMLLQPIHHSRSNWLLCCLRCVWHWWHRWEVYSYTDPSTHIASQMSLTSMLPAMVDHSGKSFVLLPLQYTSRNMPIKLALLSQMCVAPVAVVVPLLHGPTDPTVVPPMPDIDPTSVPPMQMYLTPPAQDYTPSPVRVASVCDRHQCTR